MIFTYFSETEKLHKVRKFKDFYIFFLCSNTAVSTCIEYRNLSAHGGRVYNHECSSRLRPPAEANNLRGFSQLLFLLNMLRYQQPFENLSEALNLQLSRHCSMYPEDITYLGQILNINIIQRTPVWISAKSSKYHIDQHCCGIKKPIELELSDAQKQGFQPCKKCCHKDA